MKFYKHKNLFKKSISLFVALLMMINITFVMPSTVLADPGNGRGQGQRQVNANSGKIYGKVFLEGKEFNRGGNINGKHQPNENFKAGVEVILCDSSGNAIKSDFTDLSGSYSFDELSDGEYMIKIVPPAGLAITRRPKAHSQKSWWSVINEETCMSDPIDVSDQENIFCIYAGLIAGEHSNNDEETNKVITDVIRIFPNETIPASSEYEFVYNFHGDEIEYDVEKPVEIVLVLNTSGTMNSYINGKYRGKLLEAANSFIDNLPIDKNIKVGVVRYYYKGEVVSNLEDITNKAAVKQKIKDEISISKNGTNLGDGLRRAYQLLKQGDQNADKHLVILSDGYANVGIKEEQHGREWENVPYILGLENSINEIIETKKCKFFPMKDNLRNFMDGYKDEKLNVGQEYVKGIAEEINKSDIKINSHIIHFKRTIKAGSGKETKEYYINGAMDNINEVASILGITKEINEGQKFYLVEDAYSLNTAFENIETAIEESIPFNSVYYEENFPSGVELVDYPNGLTKTGNIDTGYTLKGNISGVNMKKVSPESNLYKVDGQFTAKVKCDSPGKYDFDNGKLEYEDPAGDKGEVEINTGSIEVTGKKLSRLNILEVQPGREFELNRNKFRNLVENGNDINLVQMSMAQFICDIEEINGKYDIIYVGNKGEGYTHIGSKAEKLPQGQDNDSEEYYSENDITNRRAKDLIEYIESGQLTIFSDDIFTNNDNNTKTKLELNFEKYKDNIDNFRITSNIRNTLNQVSQLYENCNKRPILSISDFPIDYTGISEDGTSNAYEDTKVMQFIFDLENLNTIGNNENHMNVKLYLDKNGDGFFREDEMVEQGKQKLNGRGYFLDYILKEYNIGMIPWKLEIEDIKTGAKSYETGYPAYKGEKLNVRVLQITPPGNTFDINEKMDELLRMDDYNIDVTSITIDEFNDNYPDNIDSKKTELNGNYDMIIMGFNDGYGYTDLTNEHAIEAIKEFIRTEQSVMFTHDVFTFIIQRENGWGAKLTKEFRDIVGQSRYKDPNNPSELDVFGNKIIHDDLPNSNKNTYGFTNEAFERAENGNNSFDRYDKTFKLNESVIIKYPYKLPDELPVAQTHYQYYQLNLEDEDVVPWYTLNDNGDKRYDGRNYYYTYSKGNITYSGTGHTTPSGKPEQKFFINTMIKASRSSNHAPTLEVINLEEDKIVSKSQERFEFSFIARDIDGDPLSGEIYIQANDGNDVLVDRYYEGDIDHGVPVNVVLTKGDLEGILGNNEEFTIKIVVKDSKGAMAEETSHLRYLDNHVLDMSIDGEQNYLIGDLAEVNLQILAQKPTENLEGKINRIQFSMEYDDDALIAQGDNNWYALSDVEFNQEEEPDLQKEFQFRIGKVDDYLDENTLTFNYLVKNILTYNYSNPNSDVEDQTITTDFTYPISVRSGIIYVRVVNSDGTPYGNAEVTVTKSGETNSDESTMPYITDDKGILTLSNQPSGRYTISLDNLDAKYMVNGEELGTVVTETVELSYKNYEQVVSFELIDTSKIGLDLISLGDNGYLVGETAHITLKAIVHNEDQRTNTSIKNIVYSMEYDEEGLELITSDDTWTLNDVQISGSSIESFEKPDKKLSFIMKSAGDFVVRNSLNYEYLDNISKVSGVDHVFSVKSGKIHGRVMQKNGRAYEGVPVEIVNKADTNIVYLAKTDETGKYSVVDIPKGTYTVSTHLPASFNNEEDNEVTLAYNNPEEEVNFELKNNANIIKNGMYINNKFVDDDEVVRGFDAYLAAKVEVYDKQPQIRLILDENITKVNLSLYKVDDLGNLELVDGNPNIYKVVEVEDENGAVVESIEGVGSLNDIEVVDGRRKIQIGVSKAEKEHNMYLLKYTVSHNKMVPLGTGLKYNIEVNKVKGIKGKLTVVAMPTLD